MKLMSIKEACVLANISRVTLWKLPKANQSPQSVLTTGRRRPLVEAEVFSWIEGKIADRNGARDAAYQYC